MWLLKYIQVYSIVSFLVKLLIKQSNTDDYEIIAEIPLCVDGHGSFAVCRFCKLLGRN